MQTFLPFVDFTESANVLDRQRLCKQRIEAKAILNAVMGIKVFNHPTVRMWQDYRYALAEYGWTMCCEWINRGYKDTTADFFKEIMDRDKLVIPPWNDFEELHKNHRQRLIAKNPTWYVDKLGWTDGPTEYNLWPTFKNNSWSLREIH